MAEEIVFLRGYERAALACVPEYWQAPLSAREVWRRVEGYEYSSVLHGLKRLARLGLVERFVESLPVRSDRGFMADRQATTYRRARPREVTLATLGDGCGND
jgi:hypothetical protein